MSNRRPSAQAPRAPEAPSEAGQPAQAAAAPPPAAPGPDGAAGRLPPPEDALFPPGMGRGGGLSAGLRLWVSAYRVELVLFALSAVVLTFFSSERFLRQSAAPHFVYQAQAWLEGRLDIDPEVLPNLEDWACVREVAGQKVRCEGRPRPTDHWYVSFPSFPALAMVPFVALHGYQFNDTSFGVLVGALAVALFYSLLRFLSQQGESGRTEQENRVLALLLAFGTLFFSCAIRGEVWFSAEVMGVALTCLYVRNAVGARRPVLAGLFFSMATLTRTPLLFTGLFFVLEALCPDKGQRLAQLRALPGQWRAPLRRLGLFSLGAAPLAGLAAAYNLYRFGRMGEFGHSFLFNNRVNVDIDRWGLFHPVYLQRNLQAAFLQLPQVGLSPLRLGYDPRGLSLLLTLPLVLFLLVPPARRLAGRMPWLLAALSALPLGAFGYAAQGPRPAEWLLWGAAALTGALLAAYQVQTRERPLGAWPLWGAGAGAVALLLARVLVPGLTGLLLWTAWAAVALAAVLLVGNVLAPPDRPRLHWPLWLTVAVTALPGLLYQNTGYMQFGFRFSLDYTPYLMLLFAVSAWSLRNRWVVAAATLGVLVNFWGAVAFRGYTEYVRHW